MVDEARGQVTAPAEWLDDAALRTPDHAALVLEDGVVTYAQLRDQVHARIASVSGVFTPGELVPTPVRLDLPSIVEVLALPSADVVPVPHSGSTPGVPVTSRPGAVVCVATSGSGGRRRLVPLTMGNLDAAVRASRARLATGAGDRWLLTLPIDHIGGLSVLYRTVAAGGTAVVSPFGSRSSLLAATQPTVASLVPTMVHRMLEEDPDALAAIGTVLVGGGPLRGTTLHRATTTGVRLVPTYGSTESASQVATAIPGTAIPHAGYVGPPVEGMQVTIDDDGVISVDGAAVFGGYLGDPARTGPHRTSDIGRWEDDGAITVVGRIDDVVVSGGENVSLDAVADRIQAISGVDDVAIVAIDDDEWGSLVCALVATDLGHDDLAERIDDVLTGAQRPRRVIIATSVPILPNGKHDRMAVRRRIIEASDGGR